MADRLTSMAVFVKAADLGSFSAAAAALDMSAQMVGKHVGMLEERLGTELLRRTTRRQSLTAVGRAFYERCRIILAETEAAETLAHDLSTTPSGRLRISAPVVFGAACLAPLVGRYLADFPDVDVDLMLADRFVDLVDEGYDVLVRLGPLRDSTLVARSLAPYRLVACASPAYLAERGAPATPADLAAHDCLGFVFSSGVPMSDWHFTRDGVTVTVAVPTRLKSNDARVLHAAALAHQGIILQSERAVRDDLAAGRLVEILPAYAAPTREMHVIFSGQRPPTPKLRLFIDRVVAAFG